ncbi:unnamed protein product [Mytilus edulis]|uniref:Uncharacterized protein n=1 Tax=Mytilus edulis TaxID=6550 RepID=A0A8S3UNL5_MYTED|nr:unnamed protein product [Mytilus edulis]
MPTASTSTPGPVHSLFHTPCDVSDISSAGRTKDDEWDEYGDDPTDATETDFDINRIKSINDLDSLTNDHPLLVYQQPLLDLGNTQICSLCKVCNANISVAVKLLLQQHILNGSTSELENFKNLILMYAPKRHSYSPPVCRARNRLAAIDHNAHSKREVMKNRDGSLRWQRSYNKKTSRWSVHPVKEGKNYDYIQDLIRQILCTRIEDGIGMNRPLELEEDDPRRISAHLAPVPPPPTRDIVATQISRFENLDKTIDYWTGEGH